MRAPPSRLQVLPYWRTIVAVAAPLLLLPLPLVAGTKEARCGYIMILMALFWMTEATPLAVTALIPVFGFPLLGVLSTDILTEVYMTETNMMFLGGLSVAIAVEHSNLHRRIALFTLIHAGQSPRRLMMGFMLVTMFLSMWISNTATTAMMVPIVEAIMLELFPKEPEIASVQVNMTNAEAQDTHKENLEEAHTEGHDVAQEKPGISEGPVKDTSEGQMQQLQVEELQRERTPSSATVVEEWSDDPALKLSDIGKKMRICLMLSVAYSANIGGTGVVTGTTPNLILMAELAKYADPTGLTFASWMAYNIPGMVICVVIAWGWLQLLFIGIRGDGLGKSDKNQQDSVRKLLKQKYEELGSVSFHESVVMTLFVCLVILWTFRSPEFVPGWAYWFVLAYGDDETATSIGDATPAMLIVILLFLIPKKLNFWWFRDPNDRSPVEPMEGCLTWQVVEQKVPWGIVLLLGGGFAMAEASEQSGLSDWIGQQLEAFDVMPPGAIVFVICMLTAMLTEVTSNTATASILVPVLNALGVNIGVNPIYLLLPTVICCSYAFMLPVATPPNAIVFSATRMKTTDMMKAGITMNVICVCVQTIMINTLGVAIFDLRTFPDWANSTVSAL